MGGGGPSAPPPDYGAMWETVSKWEQDAAIDRDRRIMEAQAEMGRLQTRASARGQTIDTSGMMKKRTANIEKDYQKAMEKLQGSTSYSMLTEKYIKDKYGMLDATHFTNPLFRESLQATTIQEKDRLLTQMFEEMDAERAKEQEYGGDQGEGGGMAAFAGGMAKTRREQFVEKFGNTFEDWAKQSFGKVKSSYAEQEKLSKEEKAMMRATGAAATGGTSGRAAAAQLVQEKEQLANPWIAV